MKSNKVRVAGWVMSGLLSAFLAFGSAVGTFVDWEGKAEMLDHLGYSAELMTRIGLVEAILAVAYLIPRTSFVAALLLTAYFGGATATHVRVGDPFFMPIVMGVVLWISYGLRRPEFFTLAIGSTVRPKETAS